MSVGVRHRRFAKLNPGDVLECGWVYNITRCVTVKVLQSPVNARKPASCLVEVVRYDEGIKELRHMIGSTAVLSAFVSPPAECFVLKWDTGSVVLKTARLLSKRERFAEEL